MSISAVSSYSVAATTRASGTRGPTAMKTLESLFGMQGSDIRSQLDSGKSLADIASSKGVSKDVLINAIANAIKSDRPGMTADRATSMATRIATQVPKAGPAGAIVGSPPPPSDGDTDGSTTTSSTSSTSPSPTSSVHGKHHGHHHRSTSDSVLSAVSDALGMQTSDLVSALKGGQNLGQLASSKGVSEDQLLASIAKAFQGTEGDGTGTGAYGSSAGSTTGTLVNAAA